MLHALIGLVALTAMEIVLGIDNIVFISVVTSRLPKEQQALARNWGLALAMGTRILLLLFISWIVGMTQPMFLLTSLGVNPHWFESLHMSEEHFKEINEFSLRDLILLIGGLFLIHSSVREIHHKVEGQHDAHNAQPRSFAAVIAQIGLLDIIFSLDSVITAVGMVKADQLWVMITAVILAVGVMLLFSGTVSAFVERHPTVKMLALSFLLLIGVMLVAEGIGTHIEKGYIYFAMAFSLLVEFLNLRMRTKAERRAAKPAAV
jgi:predicted tellurium resistance membrane protein TerC